MSTNHTANYDLCQWEATDQVLHTDFNQDNAKLDAAIGFLSEITGKCGNCQFIPQLMWAQINTVRNTQIFSPFPTNPMIVAVSGEPGDHQFFAFQGVGQAVVYADDLYIQNFIWSENTLSWYRTDSAYKQFNQSRTYHVTALLNAAE